MTQTKEICDRCGDVYLGGPHSFLCPNCRKAVQRKNAKEIGLHQLGLEARRNRKEK